MRLGSSFLRDFGEEGSSIRGRFVLEGLSALNGDVGEVAERKGYLP